MFKNTLTHWLRKSALKTRRAPMSFDLLEDRVVPSTVVFQQNRPLNLDGLDIIGTTYIGTQDAEITSEVANANSNFGQAVSVSIDQQDALGVRQALLRFDDIFGNAPGQIPLGSRINSAKLEFWAVSPTNVESFVSFNRMLAPWTQDTVTWNSFPNVSGGVQFDGVEAEELPDGMLANDLNHTVASDRLQTDPNFPVTPGFKDVDITESLRAWASGVANFGWLNHQFGENGWDWNTSENPQSVTVNSVTYNNTRPRLTVDFTPPAGAGSFSFLDSSTSPTFADNDIAVSEGNTGVKQISIRVLRTNGSAGEAKVDYALDAAPGSATPGADYSFAAGTLTFADGERIKTFTLTVNGDMALEGPETIRLRLSNATGGASIDAARSLSVVKIVDNELLLNEVASDATGTADLGYEYIELLGAPNAALGNISINGDTYNAFVAVVNGDTNDVNTSEAVAGSPTPLQTAKANNATPAGNFNNIGRVDTVFNLSAFSVGSGGLLTIRSSDANFKYYQSGTNPAGNTDVISPLLDADLDTVNSAAEGRFDNNTNTFAIVLVPTSKTLTAGDDIDLNNDGVIDNLPAGALLLDAIGTNDIHRPSSDRILGQGWTGTRIIQANGYVGNMTRFNNPVVNDLIANRIPSWYGGTTKAGNLVYVDPSVTATLGQATFNIVPGAQLTPGALNIPRAFSFDVTSASVIESAGTVELTVSRLGDSSVEAKVNYATVGDTAVSNVDFTATSGQITFPIGVTSKAISIPLINDTLPENFETFFVNLINPTPGQFVVASGQTKVTIADNDSVIKSFQQEVDGYFGAQDTGLYSTGGVSKDNFSSELSISVDMSQGSPEVPAQGLIRFDNLFGAGANQVPAGSRIYGGQLTFQVSDGADAGTRIRFFRMLQSWDAGKASWFDPLGTGSATPTALNGVTPDDVEARAVADFEISPASRLGTVSVDVPADLLQAWANGAPNYGWAMISNSGNGWEFESADSFLAESHPKLSMIYTEPAAAGGFQFEQPIYIVNEGQTTASFTISRVGGNSGNANITYSLQGVTASAGSDFTASGGTFTFLGDGPISQTFTVSLGEDNSSERNETFQLKLSNATGGAQIFNDTATVTIRDNDAANVLLNEIYINPPATDAPFEYLELRGPAGTGLGNVYLVGLEGDSNVFAGNADTVFDLSAVNNGANGITVVTSDLGGFTPDAAATHVTSTLLSLANTNEFRTLQNSSNTFLVIYSPTATISSDVHDYDWDNDGILELPAGAVILDGLANTDGGAGSKLYSSAVMVIPPVPPAVSSPTPDAASRVVGNNTTNDIGAWWFGEILSITGNSSRYYDPAAGNSVNRPVGAVLTPGATNFVANALPSITSDGGGTTATRNVITGNSAVTTVTFSDADIGQPFAFSLSGPDAGKFSINQTTGTLAFLAAPDVNSPTDAGADNIYNVTVTLSDGTASDAQDLAVRVLPTVSGIVVNDGNAQRSRLTKITVNFSGPVDTSIFQAPGAVFLTRTGIATNNVEPFGTVVDSSNGLIVTPSLGNSLTLTFQNIDNAGLDNGSLSDGRWQLSLPVLGYASPNAPADTTLRRLFGDVDNNGTVDGVDFSAFPPFGSAAGNPFDFDNNSNVDANDFAAFGGRNGYSLI